MGGEFVMHENNEKFTQNFGGKNRKEETTWDV
jgi:hypothetical protein